MPGKINPPPRRTNSTTKTAEGERPRFCSTRSVPPKILSPGMNSSRASLIVVNASKWVNGTTLHYYFFDKKTDGEYVKINGKKVWKSWLGTAGQMEMVRKGFRQWKGLGIGLSFSEVKDRGDAEVRIGFMEDDGAWSYLGRDVLKQGTNERTMNFGWNIDTTDRYNGIDTALHEIGHTLGFPHEHQNPFAGIVWDENAVYKSLSKDPNFWDKETTYENIIKKLTTSEVNGSQWDPNSIMHYPFDPGMIKEPSKYFKNGLFPEGGLSPNDIKWAKFFYPQIKKATGTTLTALSSEEITADNSKQQDFYFTPTETRYYNIQTFGSLDTVIVLFEKVGKEKLKYLTGDDNSGTDKNAMLRLKLFRDRSYVLKARVYYKAPNERATIMVW